MTNILFGQWRDDKLPNGDYYIKVRGNLSKKAFFTYDNCINGKWAYTLDGNVIDVIAPVPSYDEYIKLVSKTEQLVQKMHILEKKLEIATEALKKYQEAINHFKKDPMNNIIMLAHQLIYDIDTDSKQALKKMEGVK